MLDHAGLTFVPLLISQYRSSPSSNIPELVKIIASTSSAKEVLLSLVECLGRLDDEAQGVDEDETDNEEDDDLPPADHVERLRLLLACFALGELLSILDVLTVPSHTSPQDGPLNPNPSLHL